MVAVTVLDQIYHSKAKGGFGVDELVLKLNYNGNGRISPNTVEVGSLVLRRVCSEREKERKKSRVPEWQWKARLSHSVLFNPSAVVWFMAYLANFSRILPIFSPTYSHGGAVDHARS